MLQVRIINECCWDWEFQVETSVQWCVKDNNFEKCWICTDMLGQIDIITRDT